MTPVAFASTPVAYSRGYQRHGRIHLVEGNATGRERYLVALCGQTGEPAATWAPEKAQRLIRQRMVCKRCAAKGGEQA